jgi:hypothetical protein
LEFHLSVVAQMSDQVRKVDPSYVVVGATIFVVLTIWCGWIAISFTGFS